MTKALPKHDFEGVVIRRDPDGYGLVEFNEPDHSIGVFTGEVLQDPRVDKSVKTGEKVFGRAERRGASFRILRLEPARNK